jgi:hypothetical protein
MVREIYLDKIHELDEANTLGYYPKEEDYDTLITEDCDVYLPDGTKVLVFRKKAITQITNYTERQWQWWRWVARRQPSIGRGNAAGKVITAQTWRRITKGQRRFIEKAMKGAFDHSSEAEIREVLSDERWDVMNYVVQTTKKDGLYDVELCAPYEKRIKKLKLLPVAEQREISGFLVENRTKVWFETWIQKYFLPVEPEGRAAAATYAWERYFGRESYNEVHSGVVGAMDRQSMVPYARLTWTSLPPKYLYEEDGKSMFEAERPFYKEVDTLFKKHMPEERKKLQNVWGNLKEDIYCLYGTSFSTITVNHNFQVAYHRDGNNCKDGIAVISTINKGSFEGYSFVFPQLRVAFDIRDGDFLCGDNQKYIHGMMPFKDESPDAESIWFVFFLREGLKIAETKECEDCRRTFVHWCKDNIKKDSNKRGTFTGIWPNMWHSQEWKDYKESKGLGHCTSTTHRGTGE